MIRSRLLYDLIHFTMNVRIIDVSYESPCRFIIQVDSKWITAAFTYDGSCIPISVGDLVRLRRISVSEFLMYNTINNTTHILKLYAKRD